MLDHVSVFTRGGVVLWSKDYTTLKGNPVDFLVRTVLLEERQEEYVDMGVHRMKYALDNARGLVFVVVYMGTLQLRYVDELLRLMKSAFVKAHADVVDTSSGGLDFDDKFDKLLAKAEASAKASRASARGSMVASPFMSKSRAKGKGAAAESGGKGKGGKAGGKGKGKGATDAPEDDDTSDDPADGSGTEESGDDAAGGADAVRESKGGEATDGDGADDAGGDGEADGTDGDDGDGDDGDGGDDGGGPMRPGESPAQRVRRIMAARARASGGARGGRRGPSSPIKGKGKGKAAAGDSPAGGAGGSGKGKGKKAANWDSLTTPSSRTVTAADVAKFDRSGADGSEAAADAAEADKDMFGDEKFDDEDASSTDDDEDDDGETEGKSAGKGWFASTAVGSFLQTLTGGKVLDEEDVAPVLRGLRHQLQQKNVASEVSGAICDSVGASLIGTKMERMTRVQTVVKEALRESVSRILTAQKSTNVLQAVRDHRGAGRPYVIVFVGVNGVGKSTSLSKVAHHLKSNGHSVLIAACDTFRSGAVEQLKKHCRNLDVELFERGYNKAKDKDKAAQVAKAAIEYAAEKGTEVVLVDTAGRMQNNKPLMLALATLIDVNSPDLVLFVGEALVGNDGVDQLMTFNAALRDNTSATGRVRSVDGIMLTKFDTIDDKVGAALSMVYESKKPIFFLGTGQKYTHLKPMNVRSVVRALLS